MMAPDSFSLPLTIFGLVIVALSTSPAVSAILAQFRDSSPKDNFYQDVDGHSSPETIAAFSNRRPKGAILALSIIGLGTSIAISVLHFLHPHYYSQSGLENWLITSAWVCCIP